MGDRSFDVAGPWLWNKLPSSLRSSDSLCQFRRQFFKDEAAAPSDSFFGAIYKFTYLLTISKTSRWYRRVEYRSTHFQSPPDKIWSQFVEISSLRSRVRTPPDVKDRWVSSADSCWPLLTQRSILLVTLLISNSHNKGKGLDTCYSAAYTSQTGDQQRFTISKVAADWYGPMAPQRIMWPSVVRANRQLDSRCR